MSGEGALKLPRVKQSLAKGKTSQKGISRSVAAGTPDNSDLSNSGSQELIGLKRLPGQPRNYFSDSKHGGGMYNRSQADLISLEVQRIERESSERFEHAYKSDKTCLS